MDPQVRKSLATGEQADEALNAFRTMLTIRLFEEDLLELSKDGLIAGSLHPCVGQEAVPVGALGALRSNDPVVCTYRGHGWAIAAGLPLGSLFAEVLGRAGGLNGGRGGSAYLSDTSSRFLGENSIVGAGLPISNGAALASVVLGGDEVAIVSFGDGATNQGASHEAIVFAVAKKLPVIFVCENNDWSEMTPITQTVPTIPLAQRASGYGIATATLKDPTPAEVGVLVREAAQRARSGEGPTFLEICVPRILGHYNADIEQYRCRSDVDAALQRDPLNTARIALKQAFGEAKMSEVEHEVRAMVTTAKLSAIEQPLADPASATAHVISEHPRQQIAPLPTEGREMAFGLAVNAALQRAMSERDNVIVYGEDVAKPGGVFGVTRYLEKNFGEERVFDTPISEAAILGCAVGASLRGLRPVAEIMWMDFMLVALDQLVNQAANVRYLSRGRSSAPLVIRTQQGAAPGSCAQHAQSLEALLAHIPGLKVGMPSTPHDAYQMTLAAIDDDDPVILIESRLIYRTQGFVDQQAPRETVGGARLLRQGRDALIVTWGRFSQHCLEAAQTLSKEGIEVGVLDLRWLSPLDFQTVSDQIPGHDGRVVIVHEANRTGGFGAEVAARIGEECLHCLKAPVRRVASPDVVMPASPALQQALLPSISSIAEAVRETCRA